MIVVKWLISWFGGGQARHLTTINSVDVSSWLPVWLLPFALAGIVALCWWRYRGLTGNLKPWIRILLVALRSLAYAALLLILALPTLKIDGEGVLPGVIPVVVDATQSMQIRDCGGQDRFRAALRVAKDVRDAAKKHQDLKTDFFLYANGLKEFNPDDTVQPAGDYTSVNQMLEKALDRYQEEYCPGVLLLTDGAHNTAEVPERALDAFRKRGVPVYACGFGKEKAKDLAVTSIIGEDVVFAEEKAQTFINVSMTGLSGQKVHLTLTLGDQVVYAGDHDLANEGETSLPVEFTPKQTGRFPLKAEITAVDGEITQENNALVKNLRVIDEKVRVLLVFGQPSWEYRYLVGAFERDKRVDLRVFLGSMDRRSQGMTVGERRFVEQLPQSAEELNLKYDMIILSRVHPVRDLPEKFNAALQDFVKNSGGGLVLLSDPELLPYTFKGTSYEALLPVVLSPTAVPRTYKDELLAPLRETYFYDVTDDGTASPLVALSGERLENRKLWSELPPLYFCYRPAKVKPSGVCLLTAARRGEQDKVPLIVHHTFGKGPVLYMGFDATWRWRKEFGDRYFRDYWGKVVQFIGLPHLLNESARSELLVADENVLVGEAVSLRARVSNADFTPYMAESLEVTVTENGVARKLSLAPVPERPGMFKGEFLPQAAGALRFDLPPQFAARPLEMRVTDLRREFQAPGLNQALLASVCASTRGHYFEVPDADNILRTMREHRPPVTINFDFTLWDSAFLLVLVLLLFSAEWLVRKLNYLD